MFLETARYSLGLYKETLADSGVILVQSWVVRTRGRFVVEVVILEQYGRVVINFLCLWRESNRDGIVRICDVNFYRR